MFPGKILAFRKIFLRKKWQERDHNQEILRRCDKTYKYWELKNAQLNYVAYVQPYIVPMSLNITTSISPPIISIHDTHRRENLQKHDSSALATLAKPHLHSHAILDTVLLSQRFQYIHQYHRRSPSPGPRSFRVKTAGSESDADETEKIFSNARENPSAVPQQGKQ